MDSAPQIGRLDLPHMPPLGVDVVTAYDAAQAALADALAGADELACRVFRFIQRRILTESLAAIEPTMPEHDPPLMPTRRRHLSRSQQRRLQGCAAALRHLDSRTAMKQLGALEHVIAVETPMVLHAFIEAGKPHGRETNAGTIRATPIEFEADGGGFVPPPAVNCRRLLLDAIMTANDAPVPPITRATWLLAAIFAIHPFVDGNGRTGRLLFHALVSEHSPCGIDWGTLPELAAHRLTYIEATRQAMAPSVPNYDARLLTPIHLMTHVAEAAITGADQALARLAVLVDLLDQLRATDLDDDQALLVLAIAADRNSRLSDFDELFNDQATVTMMVDALVNTSWLRWDRAGHLQIVGPNPFRAH
jgi:hypothetical protein